MTSRVYRIATWAIIIAAATFVPLFPTNVWAQNNFQQGLNNAFGWATGAGGLSALPIYAAVGPSLIGNIITFLVGLVFALSTLAIVIGGIMYVAALGDESKATRAKQIIFFAIVGYLIVGIRTIIQGALDSILAGAPAAGPLNTFINNIATFINATVSFLAVLAIIWAGLSYITSQGDEQKAARAKNMIALAAIGLIVSNIANGIVAAITTIIPPSPGVVPGAILTVMVNIVTFALSFLAVLTVVAMVYGGYTYITAAGDEQKTSQGKRIIIYAIIGVMVIMLSATIVNVVLAL